MTRQTEPRRHSLPARAVAILGPILGPILGMVLWLAVAAGAFLLARCAVG